MVENKFDFAKLKEKAMGSIKSMMSPAGGTPSVNPNDALGLKIAEITTLVKKLSDEQQEHVRQLHQLNELVNGAFQDIEALRNQQKAPAAQPAATTATPAASGEEVAPAKENKEEEKK
ncbi:MAG: hypothetical protein A3E84_05430 [Gammaproteobacteria bacterium RIFCSPHIGHO2_12_FULL_42_13]|nr:MAG: hypothetical protein A3E84_05430 [Gammaproteobacteria bacterium RIFCSPHIGHO2_12_FULL_42_13]